MNLKVILILVIVFIALCLILVVGATSLKAQETVVDMKDFQEGDLQADGFELKAQTKIDIHAIGARIKHSEEMYAFGWIIRADDREPVWVLDDQETKRFGNDGDLREYRDNITLPAGQYECYYYAGPPYYSTGDINITIKSLSDALSYLSEYIDEEDKDEDEERHYDNTEKVEDLLFSIKAPAGSFTKFNPASRIDENAIIDFSKPDNDYSAKKGFALKKELTLKIMAGGEYSSSDRVFVDYGLIINAENRKKVWQMDKWNTSWGGGDRKNRNFTGEVTLPAGNYLACYVTDDSHAFGEWNSPPPNDPLHYGLIIYLKNAGDRQFVGDYVDTYSEPLVIDMTRIGNNDFESKGFTLKRSTDLHIIALGEYGYQDEFVDYGWIEDLDDNEKVWEMTEDNTEHAGGASKNRKFDGIVTLPAGNYMVYYTSDDSHAYRHWNSSAPIDKEMWGISIFGAGKSFDPTAITLFDEIPESGKILVNLTRLGDDADDEKTFRLETAQRVHIFALGEGRDGEMFDYGWIEDNRTGKTIWEMTYRMTRHAGGADKNRQVDTEILLDKGEYTAHFVSDDSHSFPDFNDSAPRSPQKWGITISKK
jgi:hypothetical protein